jgi:hypothetical protein
MQQPIKDYALMPKPRQALAGPKPGASKAIAGGYGGELLLQRLKLGSARKWGGGPMESGRSGEACIAGERCRRGGGLLWHENRLEDDTALPWAFLPLGAATIWRPLLCLEWEAKPK